MADNYINPHNTPIDVHSDVAACLQDILLAEKGEEVRGTIFDAIQLMDGRTTALKTWLNEKTEEYITEHFGQLIDETIGTIYLSFECQTGNNIATCNMTAMEIYQALENDKKILTAVNFDSETRYGTICISPFGNPVTSYGIDVYAIYNGYVETFVFDFLAGVEEQITYTYERTRIGGGGGGSYTNGDGIDITNNEISVKLRSISPGLAFDSNGNLYATGGGGGSYTPGAGIDIDANDEISVKLKHIAGINASMLDTDSNGELYIDVSKLVAGLLYDGTFQKTLTPGTGISIADDAQGHPVISLDLPQAEGGGF